jgi:replicative DNA helicase
MQKPLVFVSHISEEKEIALALKKLIESTFLAMIEVFVSTGPTGVPPGKKWLDEVTNGLKACAVEIILASPESVKRPWINFEAGCGWIRDIPVIPLCHSGTSPSELPPPLGALQAANAVNVQELSPVFSVLADAVGCTLPERIDYNAFISVVKEFEATSNRFEAMATATPIAPTDGLSPLELATLVEIAEKSLTPGDTVSANVVRNGMNLAGYREIAVGLALSMLGRKDLVERLSETDFNGSQFAVVKLTDDGWRWLESNQDKLALTVNQSSPTKLGESTSEHIPF